MLAVTGVRLRLHAEDAGLPAVLRDRDALLALPQEPLAQGRRQVAEVAARLGFSDLRRHDLVSAVSEAMMNAVVHGHGGEVIVSHDGETIQVRVADEGTGMDRESLPYATL